jgi:peptidoglycan/LPS O-acetylase OafA/YrhL
VSRGATAGSLVPREAAASRAAPRIPSLDSLRGIAILMVLGGHLVPPPIQQLPVGPLLVAVARGGVILFFLLSGYLIFRNIQRQPVPVFMLRRLAKIVPSYWLNLAFILALDWSFSGGEHFSAVTYLNNFLMISDVTHDAVSGVYWTLLIEVKFYLFIAMQYALLKTRGLPFVAGGLLALSLAAFAARGHGSLFLSCFPIFYVGAYAYRAEQDGWRGPATVALAAMALATAAAMAITLPDFPGWSAAYLLICTGLLVLFLRQRLGQRWLSFLGATSYNNYLYHTMIWSLVLGLFGMFAPGVGHIVQLTIGLALSTGTAVLLYWLLEQPLVRLGRRREAKILALTRIGLAPQLGDSTAP